MGERFSFIRLTGCNLRCTYCDSSYAFHGGKAMSIEEVLESIGPHNTRHVLLTGGEPLLQRQTPALARALVDTGYEVSIETHGEISIAAVAPFCRIVMDIKTPASHMNRGKFVENLSLVKRTDEIKFVIASPEDYAWARKVIQKYELEKKALVLLSPVMPAKNAPGSYSGVEIKWLAERILQDQLGVRLQTQLHKLIWGADVTGV